ncbi:SMI1/KNR4 family protein [Microtetraspora glauca]|uniref:SMI1/KNR4 family protein n=1 Tax=unclassified Streptomyces TaxID=2593676 RepID=UPI002AA5A926
MALGDPGLERFGARTHRYALRPPLPVREIRAFEATHGIRLPEAYRSFVVEVGDGPAGPAHGLMPLTAARPDDDWAVDDEWREDRLPGRLAAPAPTAPVPGPIGGRADGLTPGTLMLTELGCGMYARLVLNGPHVGEVWQLDTDWAGFVPTAPDFRTWYEEWLG